VPTGDLDLPQSHDIPAPTGDFTPRIEGQGSAPLNSGRVEDNVPTGNFTPRLQKQGSATLNSSRLQDNVPTGDIAAPPSGLNAGVQSEEADDDASSGAGEEDVVDAGGENAENADPAGEGKEQMKSKKSKKPKLIQRMHIGGSV
jgi:hypothetical protein